MKHISTPTLVISILLVLSAIQQDHAGNDIEALLMMIFVALFIISSQLIHIFEAITAPKDKDGRTITW